MDPGAHVAPTELERMTVGDLLTRYRGEVLPIKRTGDGDHPAHGQGGREDRKYER